MKETLFLHYLIDLKIILHYMYFTLRYYSAILKSADVSNFYKKNYDLSK